MKSRGEFLLEIINVNLRGAGLAGLLVEAVEFLLLADVGAEADHLGVVFFLDPGQEHRGVETARVSENNFHVAQIKAANLPPGQRENERAGLRPGEFISLGRCHGKEFQSIGARLLTSSPTAK